MSVYFLFGSKSIHAVLQKRFLEGNNFTSDSPSLKPNTIYFAHKKREAKLRRKKYLFMARNFTSALNYDCE